MHTYEWKYLLTQFARVSSQICLGDFVEVACACIHPPRMLTCIMMSHSVVCSTYLVGNFLPCSSLPSVCGSGEEQWYALPTNVCVAWNVENFA